MCEPIEQLAETGLIDHVNQCFIPLVSVATPYISALKAKSPFINATRRRFCRKLGAAYDVIRDHLATWRIPLVVLYREIQPKFPCQRNIVHSVPELQVPV